MGFKTGIAWTDHTFNGWRGCQHATYTDASGKEHAHQGCLDCYAEKLAKRNPGTLGVWGGGGTRIRGTDAYWRQPIKWDKDAAANFSSWKHACATSVSEYDAPGEYQPTRVFTASLADVFEDWHGVIRDSKDKVLRRNRLTGVIASWPGPSDEHDPITMSDLRRDLFALIDRTPNLIWQVLTKRPQNVFGMWQYGSPPPGPFVSGYRPNVHLLTSISTQADADPLIPHLLKCHDLVPVLGVSAEPLLGEIDLSPWLECGPRWQCSYCHRYAIRWANKFSNDCPHCFRKASLSGSHEANGCSTAHVQWVIIGCESNGPKAGRLPGGTEEGYWRAAHKLIDQCREAGVAVFHKQGPVGGRVSHDPGEWPEWARVQEFPQMRS